LAFPLGIGATYQDMAASSLYRALSSAATICSWRIESAKMNFREDWLEGKWYVAWGEYWKAVIV